MAAEVSDELQDKAFEHLYTGIVRVYTRVARAFIIKRRTESFWGLAAAVMNKSGYSLNSGRIVPRSLFHATF